MPRLQRCAALALVGTMLAVAGCGTTAKSLSSSSSLSQSPSSAQTSIRAATVPSATKSLTKAELIASADVICRRVNARHKETTFSAQGDYAHLLPKLGVYQEAAVSALRKLTPPAAMAKNWALMIEDAQTFADSIVKLGQYAQANNLPAGRSINKEGGSANRQMLAIAQREGFRDCARNS